MKTEKKTNDIQYYFKKYFHFEVEELDKELSIFEWFQKNGFEKINLKDLEELLNTYNLESNFNFFKLLALYLPHILDENDGHFKRNTLITNYNNQIDILDFVKSTRGNKVTSIEIIANNGNKCKIEAPLLNEFYKCIERKFKTYNMIFYRNLIEAIKESSYNQYCKEDEKNLNELKKVQIPKGRKLPNEDLSFVCNGILMFLRNETMFNPSSKSKIINKAEGQFIFRLLEIGNVKKKEEIEVLEEDYIRSLVNNYTNRTKRYK